MDARECMRARHEPSTGPKKSGPKPASKLLRSLLSVRLYRSVDDTHAVAAVPGWRRGLRERASGAVVVAHDDLVFLFLLHRFLDLVSAEGAAERAENGGEVLAAAAADLVTENAADDRAADRADSRRLPGLLDRAHVLDHGTLTADRRDDRGRRRRRWRRDRDLFGAMPRLGSRDGLGLRTVLDRLRRLGLGFGLLGRLRRGAGAALTDRGRNPAHDGSDADEAEQGDSAGCDDDERVRAALDFHGVSFH